MASAWGRNIGKWEYGAMASAWPRNIGNGNRKLWLVHGLGM